jgi:hypothetical protein
LGDFLKKVGNSESFGKVLLFSLAPIPGKEIKGVSQPNQSWKRVVLPILVNQLFGNPLMQNHCSVDANPLNISYVNDGALGPML